MRETARTARRAGRARRRSGAVRPEGEVELCGLQAVGAEPHHLLAGLTTPPAVVLGIDHASPCLPAVCAPAFRHLVFAVESTQRKPEPVIIAVLESPGSHRRRTGIVGGIEPSITAILAIGRIEENAHGSAGAEENSRGEAVLPVATEDTDGVQPHLQVLQEPGELATAFVGMDTAAGVGDVRHRPESWFTPKSRPYPRRGTVDPQASEFGVIVTGVSAKLYGQRATLAAEIIVPAPELDTRYRPLRIARHLQRVLRAGAPHVDEVPIAVVHRFHAGAVGPGQQDPPRSRRT